MKIVHINTTDDRGGAAKIAYLLHKELNEISGIQSRMLVREKNTDDSSVNTFGISGWRRWWSILTARNHTFLGGEQLLKHAWIQEADIIHLHNIHGYYFHLPILQELAKTKKIIWTLHDMWTLTGHCGTSLSLNPNMDGLYACQGQFEYEPILWPRSRALGLSKKSILASLPVTYVTPSEWLKEKVGKSYLEKHPVIKIPNGLDTAVFHNQKNRKPEILRELNITPDKKIILFIANSFNDPVKGGDTLKQILRDKRLEQFQCIAIGKGKLPKYPHLLHIPYVRNVALISKYYASADVLVYPALADNFPSVVIESLLSGTPVIAYDAGGLKEQIRESIDGQIVAPGDYERYIASLIEILKNPPDSQEISNHAAKAFSKKTMLAEYIRAYEDMLKY
jgi:putative colanic acid biosynthesis glycosyltransferase